MGRKFIAVYTLITIIVFGGILTLQVGRVLSLRKDRISTAKNLYGTLRSNLEQSLAQEKSFHSPVFRNTIHQEFTKMPNLMLVVIYSLDEGIHYLKATSSEVLTTPLSDLDGILGFPQFHYNTFAQEMITASIAIPPRTTYLVGGIFRLLTPADIYPLFRDSLILFLLFAMGTLGVYIYNRKRAVPVTINPDLETSPQPYVKVEQCLFSPDTGLGWQEHLEKRLTLELERAAFNEQDLTLVLLRIRGMHKKNADFKNFAKTVQTSLSFEDLVFEYGQEGMAILLPNSTIDQSILSLKKFMKSMDPSIEKLYAIPECGVSSRNGRLLEGAQLILESEGALQKAGKTWKDCIAAFRSDPGKYRNFVAKKQAAHLNQDTVHSTS